MTPDTPDAPALQAALDTPVYASRGNRLRGAHGPGAPQSYCAADTAKGRDACPGPHSGDWRAPPGSDENTHGIRAHLTRTRLEDVLATRYTTEAHFASYALTRDGVTLPTQPRILKGSLSWLRAEGYEVVTTLYFADWDTPGHVAWTPETLAAFHDVWARADGPLATCGVYLSPKGARILQPLATPLVVEEAEARLAAWLASLVAVGADPSTAAVHDWTRLMRTPHHRRDAGAVVASDWRDLARMVPAEPPPALPSARRALPRRTPPTRATSSRAPIVPVYVDTVPDDWHPVADALGAALRDEVRASIAGASHVDWRRCYIALAGALCARDCPLEAVPAILARACRVDHTGGAWETLAQNRAEIGRWVVTRYAAGDIGLGYHSLANAHPTVAEALDRTTTSGLEAAVLAQLRRPAPVRVTAAEAVATIQREIAAAYGVVCIAAPPGTGKTRAVLAHSDTLPDVGARARPGSRLALSVPRHDLARQIVAQRPDRSLRIFSPVSHRRPDGTPTCIYSDAAQAFAAGGQSVHREFCDGRGKEPCSERDRCPAYAGQEGAERGSLVVGVHGLVSPLIGYAGTAGTLVVDEPTDPVFSERVSLDDLATAARYLDAFAPRFADAMTPAVAAFATWVTTADVSTAPTYVSDAIALGAPPGTADEILQGVAAAIAQGATSPAPPLLWTSVARARGNPARAHELGAASRVLGLLHRAVTSAQPYAATLTEHDGERAVTVVGLDAHLLRALRHEGPVVILDADVHLHLPAITYVLGAAPRVVTLDVVDGAPIARSILVTRATYGAWLPRGVPDWTAMLPALRAVFAWIAEDPACASIGLIAPKVLAAALSHARDPDAPGPRDAWAQAGQSSAGLVRALAVLGPLLAGFTGDLLVGHYGALRGLDVMAGCDGTVTVLDPRPNLGDQAARAAYLALDPEGRCDALAAAELGQAHGRLRTIHRTRPGRQLHVGAILPHGWHGYPVDLRRLPVGRPPTVATLTAEAFRAARAATGMGVRELARALRISPAAVCSYEAGGRAAPSDVARGLGVLVAGVHETPSREFPLQGVS